MTAFHDISLEISDDCLLPTLDIATPSARQLLSSAIRAWFLVCSTAAKLQQKRRLRQLRAEVFQGLRVPPRNGVEVAFGLERSGELLVGVSW